MKILVITGDRTFKKGHPRFDLQASAVEKLEVMYWGPGAHLPKIPDVGCRVFDVVSSQDPFWRGLLGWFLAKRLKARLNIQVHADLAAQSPLKQAIARLVLSRTDSIRVVSEKLKKQVEKLGVCAPITVLPIFIDIERFKNISRTPDQNPLILWIGRFEAEKDPLSSLEVFNHVRKEIPNAKLVMLGAGSLEGRVKQAAAGLPVEFPGFQDTAPYLARAHVALSTSPAESYGASIIEALAAGVPVVASDVGIAREAGAVVVSRDGLAAAVINTLHSGAPGKLKTSVLSREVWLQAWKKSLM